MKHIIIGGVAGGATAAARIRRTDEKAEIVLLEKGKYISYANCGLPYYIGGTIAEREKLFMQTPASLDVYKRQTPRCATIYSPSTRGVADCCKSIRVAKADRFRTDPIRSADFHNNITH